MEFALLSRSFSAQRAQAVEAFTFWKGNAHAQCGVSRSLEKESELRRVRGLSRRPDVRAAAAGERSPLTGDALPPFDSADVAGAP